MRKVTDQDERLLKLIQADLESAIFAITILLGLGEDILFNFLRIYGRRIKKENEGEKQPRFAVKYAIDRYSSSSYTYLKYTSNTGIETYIFCGHCVSIFVPREEYKISYKPLINLTKPAEYENQSKKMGEL